MFKAVERKYERTRIRMPRGEKAIERRSLVRTVRKMYNSIAPRQYQAECYGHFTVRFQKIIY